MGKTRRDFCNEMKRVYDGHGVYIGAAKSALFSTMFSSMSNENIKTVMCEIINDAGSVLKHERWEREIEETATDTEE